jgi:tetratricopeptide (TPR) repeat protein
MGSYNEAITFIEKALKYSNGKDPDILFHYAEILNKIGKYPESKKYYQKAEEEGYDKEVIKQKLIEISKNE